MNPTNRSSALNPAVLALFFALAFLPTISHLVSIGLPVTNPFAALGTVAAGFWFAAAIVETCTRFALLGMGLSLLIWSVNFMMTAGKGCCSSVGH